MALTDNLISFYKCDEASGNMNDSVGSNTCTVYNITRTTGKINGGLLIDAKSDYALFGSAFNNSTISVSLRYYCNTDADWNCIMQDAATGRHHIIINSSKQLGFYNSSTGFVGSGTTLTNGNWYHIVMIKNGTNQKFYLNNSLIQNSNNSFNNATYPLTDIGNRGSQGPLGKLDEIGIWNRELTTDEISTLYNSGNGITYPFPSTFTTKMIMF